jgi:hypothetical protein
VQHNIVNGVRTVHVPGKVPRYGTIFRHRHTIRATTLPPISPEPDQEQPMKEPTVVEKLLEDRSVKDLDGTVRQLILENLVNDIIQNAPFQHSVENIKGQILEHLTGSLKNYCFLLAQAGPTVDQQKIIGLLNTRRRSFARAICTQFNPTDIEARKLRAAKRSRFQKDRRAAHFVLWLFGAVAASSAQESENYDKGENEAETVSLNSGLPPTFE